MFVRNHNPDGFTDSLLKLNVFLIKDHTIKKSPFSNHLKVARGGLMGISRLSTMIDDFILSTCIEKTCNWITCKGVNLKCPLHPRSIRCKEHRMCALRVDQTSSVRRRTMW